MKILFKNITGLVLLVIVISCNPKHSTIRENESEHRDFSSVIFYTSAKKTDSTITKSQYKKEFISLEQPDEDFPFIMIDIDKTFQEIEGFGAAFTDAASEVFSKLSPEKQDEFITMSFDREKGNGYSLCRSTIHSCDYASYSYTYAEVSGDTNLEHFTIEHDEKYRIPFIKKAIAATNNQLKIFSSPWSPPAWMKTNNNMLNGGKLIPEYRQTWANYFIKYLQAYKNHGIDIWGLTVQNEPMATQSWESCVFTATEERDFVRDYLGPTLEKEGFSDVNLIIWDHNRGIMYQRAEVVYNDPEASKYVWGTGFHYYMGNHYDNVRIVHDAFPEKKLLHTEAALKGTYNVAEHLAKNVIMDLNNWSNGWLCWNLLLDENRGPRHHGQVGEQASIFANLKTNEIVYNPPFYYFGHFSKYIRPGAKRIACTSNNDDLIATAFVNTNGKIVVIILNDKDVEKEFCLWENGKAAKTILPPHSICTVVLTE